MHLPLKRHTYHDIDYETAHKPLPVRSSHAPAIKKTYLS